MKKYLLLLILLCQVSLAQNPPGFRTFSTTSAAADIGMYQIGSGISFHQLTWNISGGTLSACTVSLQQSPDNSTWSTLIAGQTCTSNGQSSVTTGTANYTRINVTTLTASSGTPTLAVVWSGYLTTPGGGGGALTSTFIGYGSGSNVLTGDATLTRSLTTGTILAEPLALSDSPILQLQQTAVSPTSDIFQIYGTGATPSNTCNTNAKCFFALQSNGNVYFQGNTAIYGPDTINNTASWIHLYGGTSPANAGPYIFGSASDGSHATYLYFDPTVAGQASFETGVITGTSTPANIACTNGNGKCNSSSNAWVDVTNPTYGAQHNEQENVNAAMAAGSSTLTTTGSPTFVAGDVGKSISIAGWAFPPPAIPTVAVSTGSGSITGPARVYMMLTCTDGTSGGNHEGNTSWEFVGQVSATQSTATVTVSGVASVCNFTGSTNYNIYYSIDQGANTQQQPTNAGFWGQFSGQETLDASCTNLTVATSCVINSVTNGTPNYPFIGDGTHTTLHGTITSFNNANSVGVSFSAGATNGIVANEFVSWATDDTTAINNAKAVACPAGSDGGTVFFPQGRYYVNTFSSAAITLNGSASSSRHCAFVGVGSAESALNNPVQAGAGSQNSAASSTLIATGPNEILKIGNTGNETISGIRIDKLGFQDGTGLGGGVVGGMHFIRQDDINIGQVGCQSFTASSNINQNYNSSGVWGTATYAPHGYCMFFDEGGTGGVASTNFSQFEHIEFLRSVATTYGIAAGNGELSRLVLLDGEIIGSINGGGACFEQQQNNNTNAGSQNYISARCNYFPLGIHISDTLGTQILNSHFENSRVDKSIGSSGNGTAFYVDSSGGSSNCGLNAVVGGDVASPYTGLQIGNSTNGCQGFNPIGTLFSTPVQTIIDLSTGSSPPTLYPGMFSQQFYRQSSGNYTAGQLLIISATNNQVKPALTSSGANEVVGIAMAGGPATTETNANICQIGWQCTIILDGTGAAANAHTQICVSTGTAADGVVPASGVCAIGARVGWLTRSVASSATSAIIWFDPDTAPLTTAIVSGTTQVFAVSGDFTTTVAATQQNITGLTWTMPASVAMTAYADCDLQYLQTTNAYATNFSIKDATIAPTAINASGFIQTTAAVWVDSILNNLTTTTTTAIVSFTPSAVTTIWHARLHAYIQQPSNASSSAIQLSVLGSATASTTMTVKSGSACTVHFQ